MWRLLKRTVVGACLVSLGLVASTALTGRGVEAADESAFGLRPATSDPTDPRTLSYFRRAVGPGASFADRVIVKNSGPNAVDFYVDPVDGLTGETTGAVYANREDPVTRSGAWVSPTLSRLTVAARSEAAVAFQVRVPADTGSGDHLAGIAFQAVAARKSGGRFAVVEVVRAVIGVLVQVKGPAVPFTLKLTDLGFRAPSPGFPQTAVLLKLKNVGQLLGKPNLRVSATGPAGYSRQLDRQLDTILPGDFVPLSLPWPDNPPAGTYRLCVGWDPGRPVPSSQCANVQLGAAVGAGTESGGGLPIGPAAIPPFWTALVIFVGGLVLGALITDRWRRSRQQQSARSSLR
jgi:hypothetical protein